MANFLPVRTSLLAFLASLLLTVILPVKQGGGGVQAFGLPPPHDGKNKASVRSSMTASSKENASASSASSNSGTLPNGSKRRKTRLSSPCVARNDVPVFSPCLLFSSTASIGTTTTSAVGTDIAPVMPKQATPPVQQESQTALSKEREPGRYHHSSLPQSSCLSCTGQGW